MTTALLGSAADVPQTATGCLPGGLRVTAVRLATVARVEMRLTLPLPLPDAGTRDDTDRPTRSVAAARAAVLAACLLRGSTATDGVGVETALGRIGADVAPLADAGRLVLRGGVLSGGLGDLLRLLAGAVTTMTYSDDEVAAARTVLAGQAAVIGMRPEAAVRALLHRQAPDRPGDPTEPPTPRLMAAVTAEEVRALHARALRPAHARLVLVGDLDPDRAIGEARAAFAGWSARTPPGSPPVPGGPLPSPPADPRASGLVGWYPAVREDTAQVLLCSVGDDLPLTPALRLACLAFGGHPESRTAASLRERHGYTYAVRAWPENGGTVGRGAGRQTRPGHRLFVGADTAPTKARALLECLGEELARMVSEPPSATEVERARTRLAGASLTAWSTQTGLADALADPSPGAPADPGRLRTALDTLMRTSTDAVAAAAREAFSPGRFTGVVAGAAQATPATSRHWTFRTAPSAR
ncbi:M16 family metallopeptidase [Streptomyces sp. NPDC048566]|uniref:M16 family metallopeptidase n=1 Tax=Streptomyces sp. NPDC048566 TaxID=3365569 RepID=UPI003716DD55